MFPLELRKQSAAARPKFSLNLTPAICRQRMHRVLPMICTTTPERVAAIWTLLRTPELPDLEQGPRSGVLPYRQLEVRLRGLCAELMLGMETTDRVVSAGLLYHDHHNEAHDLVEDMTDAEGAVIHAIVHRREPDFWNARYWYRRVGDHPIYRSMTGRVVELAGTDATSSVARRLVLSGTLDPLAFVDACESVVRKGAADPVAQFLRRLQHAEFEALLDHLVVG